MKPLAIESIKYVLESFVHFKNWEKPFLEKWEDFMLDSGAFTFMKSKKVKECDFDEYLSKYIDFINENDIQNFFELDIDSIVGYQKVLEYRSRLEAETHKKCIPVWHKSRGLRDWCQTVRNYDRVAIGGFAIKEIKKSEYGMINSFIRIAHRHNCEVHGLGFTRTRDLKNYNFDSVDSSSWQAGMRFGHLDTFDGSMIFSIKPECRMHWKDIGKQNLEEWNKYVEYADKNL
jgi:hypothetical protein